MVRQVFEQEYFVVSTSLNDITDFSKNSQPQYAALITIQPELELTKGLVNQMLKANPDCPLVCLSVDGNEVDVFQLKLNSESMNVCSREQLLSLVNDYVCWS